MPAGTQIAPGAPFAGVPCGFQQLTSISASTGLTVPGGAKYAVLCAEAQMVRLRDDGTAPTASVGFNLVVGVPYVYCSQDLTKAKVIQSTAGSILNVLYYS